MKKTTLLMPAESFPRPTRGRARQPKTALVLGMRRWLIVNMRQTAIQALVALECC